MRRSIGLIGIFFLGCGNGASTTKVPAYLSVGACSGHADRTTCAADRSCAWAALGETCPAGASCPQGVCVPQDPCFSHGDAAACSSDSRCAWSRVDKLCPVGIGSDCSGGGFCHLKDAGGGGCACVSPVTCPPGQRCPATECDCSDRHGGGVCTCSCQQCLVGQSCPPCQCTCEPSGGPGSCVEGGTCTCGCPVCPPGMTCPPCSCNCGSGGVASAGGGTGGPSAQGTSTCVCPTCAPGVACSCDCAADPCQAHTEEAACRADLTDACTWYALGIPCQVGQPCRSGVCQKAPPPGPMGGGCGCTCPACAPGSSCPPCSCNCGGPGNCVPPPAVCPGLGCYPQCPNGIKKDANGCDTCECA
jgi:hypothetical protein